MAQVERFPNPDPQELCEVTKQTSEAAMFGGYVLPSTRHRKPCLGGSHRVGGSLMRHQGCNEVHVRLTLNTPGKSHV